MKRKNGPWTPLTLTQKLLSIDTVNPPGREEAAAKLIARILEEGGFEVSLVPVAPGRPNLVATLPGQGEKLPLCFSGHLDTVPFDRKRWSHDPLGGIVEYGKVFGRGASDMKSGVAAMVMALLRLASLPERPAEIRLILSADQETGDTGAGHLVRQGILTGRTGALLLGEPTANYPMIGNKGMLWMKAHTRGVSAHASAPEKGENAIYKAARAVARLEAFDFDVTHPLMGSSTISVTTIESGTVLNMVPDWATIGIDVRTVYGQANNAVFGRLQNYLGPEVELRCIADAPSVLTDAENPWVREVYDVMEPILGERPVPRCITCFTDASVLKEALGDPPVIFLGPGEPAMAHRADEFCYVSKIEEAAEAYFEIGRRWLSRAKGV
jgi:succinyl-diaminopimelate desuccinylase